jgi:phage terminase large subunit-like protein
VIAYPEKGQALGSKQVRAEAASPALDGGNCFLPGFANETGTDYDPRTPQVVQEFVEELSSFDQGDHDDQVDSWSQMVNFTRTPYTGKGRVRVAPQRSVRPAALPA